MSQLSKPTKRLRLVHVVPLVFHEHWTNSKVPRQQRETACVQTISKQKRERHIKVGVCNLDLERTQSWALQDIRRTVKEIRQTKALRHITRSQVQEENLLREQHKSPYGKSWKWAYHTGSEEIKFFQLYKTGVCLAFFRQRQKNVLDLHRKHLDNAWVIIKSKCKVLKLPIVDS